MKIIKQTSNLRKPNGFSMIESLAFLIVLLLAAFVNIQSITSLQKTKKEAKKTQGLLQLETAKTRFTQDATPESRAKFNGMSNEARFSQLANTLTPSNPVEFAKTYGFNKMDIGDLATTPSID